MPQKTLVTDNKVQLRKRLIQQRSDMGAAAHKSNSYAISRNIISSSIFLRSKRIGLYMSVGKEVDLYMLIHEAQRRNKQCYAPAVEGNIKGLGESMHFLPFNDEVDRESGDWISNRYGICEPALPYGRRVPLWTLSAVFMPLAAFDAQGNRLGMGGGYYDRAFSFCGGLSQSLAGSLTGQASARRPLLIGVAFGFQQVKQVAASPLDVRMDYVVTEKGWLDCKKTS